MRPIRSVFPASTHALAIEGASAVEGIAIGRAIPLLRITTSTKPESAAVTPELERARLTAALASAEAEVALLVDALPEAEAELFAPEIEILRSLAPMLEARIAAGASAAEAVEAEAVVGGPATAASDLILDAGVRLIAALAGRGSEVHRVRAALAALDGEVHDDVVLVAHDLPPSIVASLPARVVGIIASDESGQGHTSHAAILARGRDVPLAFVSAHVIAQIQSGDPIVVDTTNDPARVWISPTTSLLADARARRTAWAATQTDDDRQSLEHLGVAVHANIGSFHERIPRATEGIGLFRTELAFAGRAACPSARELEIALMVVARRARGESVTVRLFDAGGDKPLSWIPAPPDAPDARGMELLFFHDRVLAIALGAIAGARRAGAAVRVLLPLVRSVRDVADVRALLPADVEVPVGAMIETPQAVEMARAIAAAADFVCVGTNDLAALALGADRATHAKHALDAQLLDLVRRIVDAAHDVGRRVTVCGEIAGDDDAALALVGVGVDSLSASPSRACSVRRRLARATRGECASAARVIFARTA